MKARMRIAISIAAAAAILAGCVQDPSQPVLYPVGSPVNPPFLANLMCNGEGNAMYREGMQQYRLNAQITGHYDAAEADALARSAAHRKYITCASSEGYRAVYPQ
ncbi:hypothetical protein HGP14_01930 [Rhizobium sp. P32RR-XVIII]|uniref:hypothetical protein n=1 Tax=Rhizobium sp. P32RR-XVIII TaxID=2726738 RepID=UPI001456F6FA|nr:hypothetical protein [Rhizobium sp. P32RR-XVIII]NLS02129.1 hypothetical protein [Rhizobium sp. P32RR-XVIII]